MEARAVEKFIRISSRKIRYVVELVKNKSVEEAMDILLLTPKRAATAVRKAIQSAAANATENHGMNEDDLYISKIFINEGPTLKRFKPRAKGRATRIRNRTSHIVVYVTDGKKEEVEKVGSKG